MALSDADKAEMTDLFAAGIAKGLALFRSEEEEAAAKLQQEEPPQKEGGDNDGDDGGFSLPGFLLGRK